ncbi:MAG: hypothetical protein ACK4E8_09315 [Lacibacter sp.]|jgi:hypothetical protein
MTRSYFIRINHVDNRLVIYLNGETVYDSGIVHNDPDMDVLVDITPYLEAHAHHTNELIFEGFNDSYNPEGASPLNPWHFEYRVFEQVTDDNGTVVEENDLLPYYNEKHLSNPNIQALNNSYHLVKKDGRFRVVSHSLSQKFAY